MEVRADLAKTLCNALLLTGRTINDQVTKEWNNYIFLFDTKGPDCNVLKDIGRTILLNNEVIAALTTLKQAMDNAEI